MSWACSACIPRTTAALVVLGALVTAAGGCASADERGRVPVGLDPCSIERATCRDRCRKTAVHAFSCRAQDAVVVHLVCECEPGEPVEVEPP